MRFLDLFCGAGGLSLGFASAGWECVAAVDAWPDACETYRNNFPEHKLYSADVTKANISDFELLGEVDWIIGGPPCQGFSTVGKRVQSDPRNRLVYHFARLVDEVRPQGFLIENVVGLRDMKFVNRVRKLFEKMDYHVDVAVLRSADFGVPQLRHRIFFVGNRDGRSFSFPEPTVGSKEYVSVWDAIGDLPALESGESATAYDKPPSTAYQVRMREGADSLQGHKASAHPKRLVQAISHIPDGGNRQYIPARLQPKSGFHNSYSRLNSKLPAVAVTQNMGKPSGTRCIHPFQNRGLTAREGARLQGFPDRFQFSGGITSQRLQVANAVSPILAEALATALSDDANWDAEIQSQDLNLFSLLAAI